jgi:hypothetical protein
MAASTTKTSRQRDDAADPLDAPDLVKRARTVAASSPAPGPAPGTAAVAVHAHLKKADVVIHSTPPFVPVAFVSPSPEDAALATVVWRAARR